jgi:dTDP-4-dehydrorhamnose reductase
MKKILITGANGFLGQHLSLFLHDAGYNVVSTGKGECRIPGAGFTYHSCDITDVREVDSMLATFNPDVVIHNAAMSKPDECDNNKDLCLSVNVEATRNMLRSSSAHFIYISTDFIFGEDGPHAEDEQPAPLNFYGESKLRAEELVCSTSEKACIVRPVFIYGKSWPGLRGSFLHWVKSNLEQQKPIKVVSDQLRTPTYAEDICRGIQAIIENEATGAYHLAGKDILSPYEMAIATAKVLNLDATLIEKVTADTFPEPVKRAKRSGLKIDKAQRELGYNPVSFEEGVRLTFLE